MLSSKKMNISNFFKFGRSEPSCVSVESIKAVRARITSEGVVTLPNIKLSSGDRLATLSGEAEHIRMRSIKTKTNR